MGVRRQNNSEKASVPSLSDLLDSWVGFSKSERKKAFSKLQHHIAEELFLNLAAPDQAELFLTISPLEKRSWIRLLAPDDAADLIQELPEESRADSLSLLDVQTKTEVSALLAYAEDDAGGLMNFRFARLRPDMSVGEAIRYLLAQTRSQVEIINYAYVLDTDQKLLGVVSLRQLFTTPPEKKAREIMQTDLITIPEDMDQEQISQLFSQKSLMAVPVVDTIGRMKGIVTVDDIVEVVKEEATEDIQKIGGMEALDAPYLDVNLFQMVKKRASWLLALFIGEMFTANAMGYYEKQIERAVVLALFIPLIISSGGNSGSQASTLVIRAMALGEVRLRDWWRIFFREAAAGLTLGGILGIVGLMRVLLWPARTHLYGEHYFLIACTVGFSLVGIVLWGTLAGAMLPLLLKKIGVDPAAASAPFVATLVDVTGLVIYFTTASLILGGILL